LNYFSKSLLTSSLLSISVYPQELINLHRGVYYTIPRSTVSLPPLTLWRPLLSYGYSYEASCARPG